VLRKPRTGFAGLENVNPARARADEREGGDESVLDGLAPLWRWIGIVESLPAVWFGPASRGTRAGFPLIETSNRRKTRPRLRAGQTRESLDARREEPPPRLDLDRARWRKLSGTLGLVGLTAVTSWVVSSISVWLVPVYVGAMVLIFAVPRTNRPKPARTDEPGESSPGEDPIASASVEVRVNEEPPSPVAETEAADETPPKPRKRRVRARKSAKKGAEALNDASALGQVTWVRVGPGKFVRSVVPVAEFVGPPAPEAGSDASATTATEPEPEPAVEPDVESVGEAGAGDRDGLAVPASVEELSLPQVESPSIADDSQPAPGPGPDGEPRQDLWMNQDDPASFDEALEEIISPEPSEAAEVEAAEFAIEYEHESEFASLDVSESIAEEHGNAPSTLGEGPETALDFEAGRDGEPWSAFASFSAAEAIVDVEVERREPVGLLDSPKVDAKGRRAGFGLFFSASLRRPRRTAEPAVVRISRRLGNARRAVETRVRHRAEAIRGRRANIQRDFHPRSPPARS